MVHLDAGVPALWGSLAPIHERKLEERLLEKSLCCQVWDLDPYSIGRTLSKMGTGEDRQRGPHPSPVSGVMPFNNYFKAIG